MKRWILAGAIALLGGCALGPDYHPPQPGASAAGPLAFRPDSVTPLPVPDAWWNLYDDPVLERLVRAGFAANTDLRVAEANLDAARAALGGARSARLPVTGVSAGAAYGRTTSQTQIADALGGEAKTGWLEDAGMELSYEVDLFGRVRRSVEGARADADAAAAERDAVRLIVASETIRAYVTACSTAQQIAVAQRLVSLTERQEQIVARQFAAGGAAQFDVTRSATVLAVAQASIPVLEGERRAALFALAAMLGSTPDKVPTEAEACTMPPGLVRALPVGDGSALLQRRPDVRLAERRLAAASARIGVAEADLLPRISLLGSVSTAAPEGSALGTRASTSFGLGPLVSWSFPNLGAARSRVAGARAVDRAALARFDGAVVTALKEVEQALARYGATLDRAEALGVAVTSARRSYAMALSRQQAGATSQLELLAAEQALVDAENAAAQSDSRRADSLVTVFKALGGGWQHTPRPESPLLEPPRATPTYDGLESRSRGG